MPNSETVLMPVVVWMQNVPRSSAKGLVPNVALSGSGGALKHQCLVGGPQLLGVVSSKVTMGVTSLSVLLPV